MGVVNGIRMGLDLVMSIARVFIAVYGTLIIGLILIGVVANIALSGDINVTDQANTTLNTLESQIANTVGSITSPLGVIASLIIVGVLVLMFPNFGMGGSQSSKSGGIM